MPWTKLIDDTLKLFSHAHIQPLIDYASIVWDGARETHLLKLNFLCKRAARIMLPGTALTTDFFLKQLGILPLQHKLKFNNTHVKNI